MPLMAYDTDGAQALMTRACSPCHTTGNTRPNLNMVVALAGVASNQSPGLAYIEPGDRLLSYLWHKINGTHLTPAAGPGRGSQMPRGGRLSADEIERFGLWIEAIPVMP